MRRTTLLSESDVGITQDHALLCQRRQGAADLLLTGARVAKGGVKVVRRPEGFVKGREQPRRDIFEPEGAGVAKQAKAPVVGTTLVDSFSRFDKPGVRSDQATLAALVGITKDFDGDVESTQEGVATGDPFPMLAATLPAVMHHHQRLGGRRFGSSNGSI